jgi:hypothetical protein
MEKLLPPRRQDAKRKLPTKEHEGTLKRRKEEDGRWKMEDGG